MGRGAAGLFAKEAQGKEGVGGVLAAEEISVLAERGDVVGGRIEGVVDDGGRNKDDVNAGVIGDGALAGVGEVIEELAVGGDHGVGPGHAADGGQPDGQEEADDGNHHEQFDGVNASRR